MKTLFGIAGGLGIGTIGAGVGRAVHSMAETKGLTPNPATNPRLAPFVRDAALVAGALPFGLAGMAFGQWVGSKIKSAAGSITK